MSNPPRISEAEWDVMDVVWDREPITGQEVHDQLGDARDWNVRTVKTLLGRLVKKGALAFEADGRRYLYSALVSREQCVRAESETFVSRVLRGNASPLVRFFVREGHLSRDEIAELRAFLEAESGGGES